MKISKYLLHPFGLLVLIIAGFYWPFFLQGKIPMPADTLIGAYFPWLDYKWGFSVGVPVKNALISDVFSQFFIWKYLAVEMWRQGVIPLWNPYAFSGYPFLATYHSAVFLPFNLLLLLPQYFGWGMYIFAQHLVAGVGMYLLTSRYIKNPLAQISGALVFAFSGLMTTWTEFGTGVYAAGFLAWSLYFLDRSLKEKKWRFNLLLILSQVMLYLSGHAQLTIYSSVLLMIYTLFFAKNYRQFFIVGLSLALAFIICLVQFLPTYDLTKASIRTGEAYTKSFNFGLNPPYELIRLFAADIFGNPTTYNHWDQISYHEQSSFIGIVAMILFIPFFWKRFRFNKEVSFWFYTAVVSLFLAFDTPVTQFIYSQPLPFLTYSSASRIFFISSLSIGILVGCAIQLLLEKDTFLDKVRAINWYVLAGLAGVLIGLVSMLIFMRYFNLREESLETYQRIMIALRNLIIPFGIGAVSWMGLKFRFSKKILLILMLGLITFDMYRYFSKYNPFIAQNITFPTTPVIDFLQQQPEPFRIARADYEVMTPNTWMHYRLSSVEGYDPLALENYARVFNVINKGQYQNAVSRYVELNHYPSLYLDALNTKYFLAVKRNSIAEIGKGEILNYRLEETNYKKVFEDKSVVVLENPNVKERAYFVNQIFGVNNSSQLIDKIQDAQFDPTNQAIYISDQALEASTSAGTVKIESTDPNFMALTTQSSERGFVVVANTFENGWQLYIDQQKQPLYEVNGALQGFWVDSGQHSIQLHYWPDSFAWGWRLSSGGGLIFMGLFGFSLWKKRF